MQAILITRSSWCSQQVERWSCCAYSASCPARHSSMWLRSLQAAWECQAAMYESSMPPITPAQRLYASCLSLARYSHNTCQSRDRTSQHTHTHRLCRMDSQPDKPTSSPSLPATGDSHNHKSQEPATQHMLKPSQTTFTPRTLIHTLPRPAWARNQCPKGSATAVTMPSECSWQLGRSTSCCKAGACACRLG